MHQNKCIWSVFPKIDGLRLNNMYRSIDVLKSSFVHLLGQQVKLVR